MEKRSIVIASGSYLPDKVVTNIDLEKEIDTSDEWITERTGIKSRHIAKEDEMSSDMAVKAALHALEFANISKDEIDMIIVATTTPDRVFPSTAVLVQYKLGLDKKNIPAFDVQAVCSGLVYAISIADSFIKSGQVSKILVIGAEKMSSIVDWQDRRSCVLFGDGASAIVLGVADVLAKKTSVALPRGIIDTKLYANGSLADILYVEGGINYAKQGAAKIKMEGQEVFRHAVEKMADCVKRIVEDNGFALSDVDLFIPHQANIRILKAVARKLRVSMDKFIITIATHANTSAASIGLAIDDAVRTNRVKSGDLVVIEALGGGLTWGSCLVRW